MRRRLSRGILPHAVCCFLLPAVLFPSGVHADLPPGERDSRIVEEVIVSASRLKVVDPGVGLAGDVLPAGALATPQVLDALAATPGVYAMRTGGYAGLGQIRVRGAEANHVAVRLNGIDVAPADTGELDATTLLGGLGSRVEIVRGPQSGVVGSNALAGVLAVETPLPNAGFDAAGYVEAGSHSSRHGGLMLAGAGEAGAVRFDSIWHEARLDISRLGDEADASEALDLRLRGRWDVTPGTAMGFALRDYRRDADADDFAFDGSPEQGLARDADLESNNDNFSASLSLEHGFSDSVEARVAAAFTRTELDATSSFGPFGSRTLRRQAEASLTVREALPFVRALTAFVEVEHEAYRNTEPTDASQVAWNERDLDGLGLEAQLTVAGADIGLALRRDGNDNFRDATTWRISVERALAAGLGVHASAGRGVTNPTFFEQFGFTPGFFTGNPDLRPETSIGWDVGLSGELADGAVLFDVTWFQADLDDEIQPLFPSVVNADGESERRGLETLLEARIGPGDLRATWTWTDTEDADGNRELLRARHDAYVRYAWRFTAPVAVWVDVRWTEGVVDNDFRNFFASFAADRIELDDALQVGLGADWRVNRKLSVSARVENLFDERYEEAFSYNTPGRAAFVRLDASLGR